MPLLMLYTYSNFYIEYKKSYSDFLWVSFVPYCPPYLCKGQSLSEVDNKLEKSEAEELMLPMASIRPCRSPRELSRDDNNGCLARFICKAAAPLV